MGVITGSEIAIEYMRTDKGGKGGVIINTASIAGTVITTFTQIQVLTI